MILFFNCFCRFTLDLAKSGITPDWPLAEVQSDVLTYLSKSVCTGSSLSVSRLHGNEGGRC